MSMVQPIATIQSRGAAGKMGFMDGSGAVPTFFGSTFGTPEAAGGTSVKSHSSCRKFKGFQYGIIGNEIYKSDGSGTPTLVWTFLSAMTFPSAHLPLLLLTIAGVPTLCTAYNVTATNNWKIVKSTDGTTWTEPATVTGLSALGGNSGIGKTGIFRNVVHWQRAGGASGTDFIDFANNSGGTANSIAGGMVSSAGSDYAAYKGVFYRLAMKGDNFWHLWQLNGSIWEDALTITPPASYVGNADASAGGSGPAFDTALFADGSGNLIAMGVYGGSFRTGYGVTRITGGGLSPLSQADITTILPTFMIAVFSPGDNAYSPGTGSTRINVYQELDSTPGVVSTHLHIAHGNVSGLTWNYYTYNGVASKIGLNGVANDFGGDVTQVLQSAKAGTFADGGSNIWDPTSAEIFFVNTPGQVLNGETDDFFIVNPGLVGTRDVSGYFTKTGQQESATPMHFKACSKVSGPGAAPTLAGNHLAIQGCTGDGVTIYRGTWDTVADGVVALDRTATTLDAR